MLILPAILKHTPKQAPKLAGTKPVAHSLAPPTSIYFRPTATSLSSLRSNNGQPAFKHFKAHPPTPFEEVYYDTLPRHGALANQGLHLRRRAGLWQLVCKSDSDSDSDSKPGHHANKQLHHQAPTLVQGREDVENVLAEKLGWESLRLGIFGAFEGDGSDRSKGLKEVGRWVCGVEKWDVDRGCKVVVHETEFGYMTGRVSCGDAGGDDDGVDNEGEGEEKRLEKMVREYGWAFPRIGMGTTGEGALQGLDDGKLEAYLDARGR